MISFCLFEQSCLLVQLFYILRVSLIMYSIIKSKRVVFGNKQPSPIIFCTFLNQQRVLVLHQSSHFKIIDITKDLKPIIFEDNLNSSSILLDCKRIKQNVCVVLSKQLQYLSLLKYVSDTEVMIGSIYVAQLLFFKEMSVTAEITVFGQKMFMIKSQLFRPRITYFSVFREKNNAQYSYEIEIKTHQHDPVGSFEEIVKEMRISSQIAVFKQKQIGEVDWKLKIISLQKEQLQKQVNLTNTLTDNHSIVDIVAKSKTEYLLFTYEESQQQGEKSLQVFQINIYDKKSLNQKYYQQIVLLNNFQMSHPNLLQIIDINPKSNYFLVRSFYHKIYSDQILDNLIQLRDLQTGEFIDQLPCNIKNIQFSPNHTKIVDFSQDVNMNQFGIFHVRSLVSKKCVYYKLLRKGQLVKNNFKEILSLL